MSEIAVYKTGSLIFQPQQFLAIRITNIQYHLSSENPLGEGVCDLSFHAYHKFEAACMKFYLDEKGLERAIRLFFHGNLYMLSEKSDEPEPDSLYVVGATKITRVDGVKTIYKIHFMWKKNGSNNCTETELQTYLATGYDEGVISIILAKPELLFRISKEQRKEDYLKAMLWANTRLFKELDADEKTPVLCKIAVSCDGYLIDEIEEQTDDLCYAALKQTSWALRHIRKPSLKMKLFALRKNPYVLNDIQNRTVEMCLLAIVQEPLCIFWIDKPSALLMEAAAKAPGLYKHNDMPQYYNAVLKHIQYHGGALQYIKRELWTLELCETAVKNCPNVIRHIGRKMLDKFPELKQYQK